MTPHCAGVIVSKQRCQGNSIDVILDISKLERFSQWDTLFIGANNHKETNKKEIQQKSQSLFQSKKVLLWILMNYIQIDICTCNYITNPLNIYISLFNLNNVHVNNDI